MNGARAATQGELVPQVVFFVFFFICAVQVKHQLCLLPDRFHLRK